MSRQSFALEAFELVEAIPGTALLRIAAAPSFDPSGSTLIVGGSQRILPLRSPPGSRGTTWVAFSVPAELAQGAQTYALGLRGGETIALPAPIRSTAGQRVQRDMVGKAPFQLRTFEVVEAVPGTALLRIAAAPTFEPSDTTLIVNGSGRMTPLQAPPGPPDTARITFSMPAEQALEAQNYALEFLSGETVELPVPVQRAPHRLRCAGAVRPLLTPAAPQAVDIHPVDETLEFAHPLRSQRTLDAPRRRSLTEPRLEQGWRRPITPFRLTVGVAVLAVGLVIIIAIANGSRAPVVRVAKTPTASTPTISPGRAVDTSDPTEVIGDGQPASCTWAAVVYAVAAGGIITFNCGPLPVTIRMAATADLTKTDHLVVLDGGGKITLSGEGQRQILFSDTCAGTFSTDDCVNQPYPQVVVQNMTFEDGSSSAQQNVHCTQDTPTCYYGGVDGGGAIYAEGGRFEAINSTFVDNSCFSDGPDLGGGAIRALAQYQHQPVYLNRDTFTSNSCSNGGAVSSIDTSWDITNSTFTDNSAVGFGANPAASGTLGGGSGGAVYLDGQNDNIRITSTTITGNTAREGGGAIFDVVDRGYGALTLDDTHLSDNTSGVFQTAPGIYYLVDGVHTAAVLKNSTDN